MVRAFLYVSYVTFYGDKFELNKKTNNIMKSQIVEILNSGVSDKSKFLKLVPIFRATAKGSIELKKVINYGYTDVRFNKLKQELLGIFSISKLDLNASGSRLESRESSGSPQESVGNENEPIDCATALNEFNALTVSKIKDILINDFEVDSKELKKINKPELLEMLSAKKKEKETKEV